MPISGGGQRIKSIQRGEMTIAANGATQTATISSVNPAKSQLRLIGCDVSGIDLTQSFARLRFDSATQISCIRNAGSGLASAVSSVTYEVTEWE